MIKTLDSGGNISHYQCCACGKVGGWISADQAVADGWSRLVTPRTWYLICQSCAPLKREVTHD